MSGCPIVQLRRLPRGASALFAAVSLLISVFLLACGTGGGHSFPQPKIGVLQDPSKNTVTILWQGPEDGKQRLLVDDSPTFRTPILSQLFPENSLSFDAWEAGLAPGTRRTIPGWISPPEDRRAQDIENDDGEHQDDLSADQWKSDASIVELNHDAGTIELSSHFGAECATRGTWRQAALAAVCVLLLFVAYASWRSGLAMNIAAHHLAAGAQRENVNKQSAHARNSTMGNSSALAIQHKLPTTSLSTALRELPVPNKQTAENVEPRIPTWSALRQRHGRSCGLHRSHGTLCESSCRRE